MSSMLAMGMPAHVAFFVCILQDVDVLGDAVRLGVVVVHVGAEGNHDDGVGSGKLGGIAVFGDTAERVRGCDCHGGASSFFGIKFKLDFNCRRQWGTKGRII